MVGKARPNRSTQSARKRSRRQPADPIRDRSVDLEAKTPAFVALGIAAARQAVTPSMEVQARLPNGVVVDLRGCEMHQALAMVETLGRLRCSASTKD